MVPGVRRIPTTLVSNDIEGDVRRRLVIYEQQEPKYLQEIEVLRRQVQLLTHRSEQLQAEKDNAQYNTQIWQKRVQEQQEQICERDQAITNLLRRTHIQSNHDTCTAHQGPMESNRHRQHTNEQQTTDTTQQERANQQHASMLKLKDDVIHDLQRQVRQLEGTKNQLVAAQTNQVSNLTKEVQRLRTDLKVKEQEYHALREKDQENTTQSHERNMLERDSQLRSLRIENESQMKELRELKRELWKAKESSKQVPSLKKELDEAQEQMRMLQGAQEKAMEQVRRQLEEHVRTELQAAEQTHRYLEERLSRMEAEEVSINQQTIANQEECIAQLEATVRDLTKRLESKTIMVQEYQTKLQSVETKLEQEVERARMQEKVRSEAQAAEQAQRTIEERLSRVDAEQVSKKQQTIAKQQECIAQLEETVQDLTKHLESKSTMLQKCQKKLHSVELELERAQLKVEDLLQGETGSILQIGDICDLLESKINELESTTRRMEQLQGALDKTEEELQSVCHSASSDQDKLKEQYENCKVRLQEAQATIRKLESDLQEARKEVSTLRDLRAGEQSTKGIVPADNPKSDQSQEVRQTAAESESSIVNTYERRLLDLRAEKDGIIDNLQKDIATIRAKRADEVSELNRQIASLRAELEEMQEDYGRKLQCKEQHIFALEQTLHAQERTMDNMRIEMDQLQSSMRDVSSARRSEVEGLQQEVIALKTELSKLEKEASKLRIHLKDEQLARQTEVVKLQDRIAEYESELPKVKAMGRIENDQRILMVKERLEQLRIRNNELKEENKQLGERLEKGIIKIHTLEMRCSEADECKIECEILRRQVAELQETLEHNQCLDEVSSLPEMEMSTASTGGKSTIRPTLKLAVGHHARPTRRSIPVGRRTSLSRFFARPKFSSASKAALMIEAK